MSHPVFDLPTPFVLAHRGGAAEAPENSLSAFQRAAAIGVAAMETDLRVTSDGVCVVAHDARLDRTTDAHGRIAELPWTEVARARIGGIEPVLRLEQLLEALPGAVVNLDLKDDAVVPAFVTLLRANPGWLRRICVGSFSDARLARVRAELGPSLATSLGPREVARLRFRGGGQPSPGLVAAQVPRSFGPVRVVTGPFVASAARLGLQVHVWTVDDEREMERLLHLGVAGIVTDRPTLAQQVVSRFSARPGAGA